MRHFRSAGIVVVAMMSIACAQTAAKLNGLGTERLSPVIEADSFEPTVTVNGIDHYLPDRQIGKDFIRTMLPRDGSIPLPPIHQLYIAHQYSGDWKFWDRANGQDARPLDFVSIARDVVSCAGSAYSGCSLRETFGVILPDSVLRAHRDGYAVKLYAKNGESMIIPLDSLQINTQLRVVDSVRTAASKR